ncbi:hypothetical protein A2375_01135 [Candidatus Woesebacteria bacterium RIFOXYB1_FULL_31_120]|uniref:Glycosyl transferase family 39 n=1 Tax=Candidatus Woesebacteria bacterium GW2011_GWC2_31_9 TaxID=1618586 RepID=A0A0G0BJ37_9BACT|nr:MAG: PMT family glycosyltransferase, 4-amino-4-deoxy-L-arabinose transferase [Candidatus Woesebacteria bacterium GW2011_GWF1_31_35]KKP23555.1 MAG: Glycosyl transferase family 39 [Candidatus Woesebacteria bacterium GW2011_GWC1_30_29]KKP25733.1 MAG: Glycosyl transferase family 39 [Candidatus Woesebacteria bacterium GW2011_GWD1_31_12]KKP27831.1 MAG: Glycosyl transferase family 39 [Candidatus Woesebacteria bacterium GW2011_GWB1_31_29]KKP31057.1 MAG: Glycosyl transferase family 39 [Candidatus Woe
MNNIFIRLKTLVKNEYFILSLIVLLGLIIRLYKINNPIADWHSWRQSDTSAVSRNFIKNGINMLYPTYDDISSIQSGIDNPKGLRMVEFPIYNAVHATAFSFVGFFNLETWGRLLSVLFALISACFLFLIGKKIYSSRIGLIASFFYLIIPYNIFFTRTVLPESLGVSFALSGMYFLICFSKKEDYLNLILSGILFSLSLLIKPFFIFYFIPFIPIFWWKVKLFKKLVIFSLITFLPLLLWRFWISNFPEGIPFFKWAFNGDRIRFHPAFFRWIFGERLGILILGTWGLVPFFGGIIAKFKNKFSLHFILGMFLYVTVVATANVRHDYYQIMTIPAISLMLSLGSIWLWKKSKIILFLSILIMMIIGWDKIKPFYQINHPELIEVGKIVDTKLPEDALIIAPYTGDTAFLYQMNRKGWPAIDASIDNIIERGADYYVSIDLGSKDTTDFEKRFVTLQKTSKYIILDLHKELVNK